MPIRHDPRTGKFVGAGNSHAGKAGLKQMRLAKKDPRGYAAKAKYDRDRLGSTPGGPGAKSLNTIQRHKLEASNRAGFLGSRRPFGK